MDAASKNPPKVLKLLTYFATWRLGPLTPHSRSSGKTGDPGAMLRRLALLATLPWLALTQSSCRQAVGPQGAAEVRYTTSGITEPPSSIDLYLYNRQYTPYNCGAFNSTNGYNSNSGNTLNINGYQTSKTVNNTSGTEQFTGLETGNWFIVATAKTTNGLIVGQQCREFRVESDNTVRVDVTVSNRPIGLGPSYYTDFELGSSLPGIAAFFLRAFPLFCSSLFNIDPDLCDLLRSISSLLGKMRVDAIWEVQQSGTVATFRLYVDKLNGISLDPGCRTMFRESVSGTINGIKIENTDEEFTIDSDTFLQCMYNAGLLRVDVGSTAGALFATALSVISGGVTVKISEMEITAPGTNNLAGTLRGKAKVKVDLTLATFESTQDITASSTGGYYRY